MNIEPTAEQYALVEAVAAFLGEQMPADRFIKKQKAEQQQTIDTGANWPAVAELGLFGITLPEAAGGIALGYAEEVLLFREAGRYLVSPCAIATAIAAKIAAQRNDFALSGKLLAGDARAAFAIPDGNDKVLLIDSENCDYIVVAADVPVLFGRSEFSGENPLAALDETISLIEVTISSAAKEQLAAVHDDLDAIALQLTLLISAYLCGSAKAACDTAVAYANQREQFGRPIGSFQAIAHICADMAVQSEAAWKQTLVAALTFQENAPDPEFHAAAAHMLAVRAALQSARDAIQVHGGVGFTQEYTPHLYLKRTHLLERIGGGPNYELLLEGGVSN